MAQSEPPAHTDHCLIALRDEVLCNADDTPRWSGGNGTATGQNRLCRDWSKLDRWAASHSACYVEPDTYQDGKKERERYVRCPDGSHPSKTSTPSSG